MVEKSTTVNSAVTNASAIKLEKKKSQSSKRLPQQLSKELDFHRTTEIFLSTKPKSDVDQVLTFLLGKIDNFRLFISFLLIFTVRYDLLRNYKTFYICHTNEEGITSETKALRQKDAHLEKYVVNSLIYIPTFMNDFK